MNTTNQTATRFPLTWPAGKPRTARGHHKRSAFKTTFGRARDDLLEEIRRLNGSALIISTNLPLRNDGMPYANGRCVDDDTGVAVYFDRKGKRLCFACDLYYSAHENMRAITLTVGALRGIARWGTGDMMETAISGFAALPEKSGGTPWWDVLRVSHDATAAQIEDAFRLLAKISHPDAGGSAERWHELSEAKEQGLQVARGRAA